jgi:hypothetical protein
MNTDPAARWADLPWRPRISQLKMLTIGTPGQGLSCPGSAFTVLSAWNASVEMPREW